VLSNNSRLRILKMHQTKHFCVYEMTSVLNLATSTESKNLSIFARQRFYNWNKRWQMCQLLDKSDSFRSTCFLNIFIAGFLDWRWFAYYCI